MIAEPNGVGLAAAIHEVQVPMAHHWLCFFIIRTLHTALGLLTPAVHRARTPPAVAALHQAISTLELTSRAASVVCPSSALVKPWRRRSGSAAKG